MRRHPARARAEPGRARSAVWLTIGALAAISLAGCASGASSASSATAGEISISTGGCGGGWHLAAPGWHTFQIHNSAADAAEVELINPANGTVYETVEALGAGTTDPMRLDVGSGSYAFRCLIEDTDAITGPTEKVPGHTAGATAILPVTDNDLYTPANEYHKYVTAGLVTLVSQVTSLNKTIQGGNLAAARSAWLPAHLTYERLGAAYGSFGDFDGEIDGRADGLVGGVSSPGWTGFYRLEYGLWHGQSAASLEKISAQLVHDVRALQTSWPSTEIDLLDIGLRTHEILENALQFQISGHDDYGSGTTLATTEANITGTEVLLTELHPLLAGATPACPRSPPGWTGCRS